MLLSETEPFMSGIALAAKSYDTKHKRTFLLLKTLVVSRSGDLFDCFQLALYVVLLRIKEMTCGMTR